jgi:hypothetical protein
MQQSPIRIKRMYSWYSDSYTMIYDPEMSGFKKHKMEKDAHCTCCRNIDNGKHKTLRTHRTGK